VRVGNTVRRLPKGNVAFVHELLLWLENQGFDFAPRFLGMDEGGREILSYLEGQTWPGSGSQLADDLLVQVAQAIRKYHDLTAGSQLSQDHELVAHNELGPHNTIVQDGHLVGFIDWDDAAPGTRLRDLANAIFNYVDVSHWSKRSADEQARRIDLMCAAYGWDDPLAIINDARGRCTTGVTQSCAGWSHRRAQDFCRRGGLDARAGRRSYGWRSNRSPFSHKRAFKAHHRHFDQDRCW
jgi:hypothetical protein